MQTLDELLSQRAVGQAKEQMAAELNHWTKENRDEKMSRARQIAESVADEAIVFVQSLIDRRLEGKSILWNSLMFSLIQSELQMLIEMRDELDATPENQVTSLPIDTGWITQQIRRRYEEAGRLSALVEETILSAETETEDL